MAKRRGKRSASGKANQQRAFGVDSSKTKKVINNLFVFFVLFVVSLILFNVVPDGFWSDLLFLLMLVFGFVALAFLIVWLILLALKAR